MERCDTSSADTPWSRRRRSSAIASAVEHLARPTLDGFFIHLDADSLNDNIMPAVDYRLADGLSWDEMKALLTPALSSDRAVGMELTIYNPALDENGAAGRELTDTLIAALRTVPPKPDTLTRPR